MTTILRTGLSAAIALQFALAPALRAETHPHARNGFMIGFGIGGGSVGVEDGDDREASFTGNFRVGGALRQDLALHLEAGGWTKEFDGDLGDVTWTFSSANAAMSWFPGGGGTFLRPGVGLATVRAEIDAGNVTISEDETGLALLFAVGHEWRLTQKFALGPHGEITWMTFDDFGEANLLALNLDFDWYW